MNKHEVDQLYHLLRRACVDGNDDPDMLKAIDGIVKHTIVQRYYGGHYPGLLRFLDWYGNKFLIKPIISYLKSPAAFINMNDYERVVELGAGLGWIGIGVSSAFKKNVMFIDKRPVSTPGEFLRIDLETEEGVSDLIDKLSPCDLIIGSEFLHCINNPRSLLSKLNAWDKVFIEQHITPTYPSAHITSYNRSYIAQLMMYGANCITTSDLPAGEIAIIPIHTHSMIMIKKTTG